jgi:hypothetical protein
MMSTKLALGVMFGLCCCVAVLAKAAPSAPPGGLATDDAW